MKYFNPLMLVIVISTLAGCAVVPVQQPAPMRPRPDMAMFGRGRAPIPPRPPVRMGQAALGVPAPFANSARTLEIKNRVLIEGDNDSPGIIKEMWVAGINKPLTHFAESIVVWDHLRPVPWLVYNDSIFVSLPPCQFLDGSPRCQVRIVAQVASWQYDMAGRQIPDGNESCVTVTVSARARYTELLWNNSMKGQVACPEEAGKVAVLGDKK